MTTASPVQSRVAPMVSMNYDDREVDRYAAFAHVDRELYAGEKCLCSARLRLEEGSLRALAGLVLESYCNPARRRGIDRTGLQLDL
jgi:hypothetical protein